MNVPTSLPEFQKVFPDEDACRRYVEQLRWPDGFVCPECGKQAEPYRFATRASCVLRCRGCKANTSLTAGTVMHKTRTPLLTWFWGAYLAITQTPGQSALQFQRQLGIGRYETAFQMLHKLRAGMVRPARGPIGATHPVEVDETFVGGATKGEGRGVHHKSIVVGAVEVRVRRDGEVFGAEGDEEHRNGRPLKRRIYAGRLRLAVVPDRSDESLQAFVATNIADGALVRTDGCERYRGIVDMGYRHDPLVLRGSPKKTDQHLPMIHIVFSNLKTWLAGTHHGVSPRHLQAYLNEFVFRFNRRFHPMLAFHSVLGIASQTEGPTYDNLYSGVWAHTVG